MNSLCSWPNCDCCIHELCKDKDDYPPVDAKKLLWKCRIFDGKCERDKDEHLQVLSE